MRLLKLKIFAVVLLGLCLSGMANAAQKTASQKSIAKGKYLTTVGDCAACHTARDGKPFAGGMSLPTPFGSVSAPNITPHKATGIGDWSFEDFWQALHFGKSADGSRLYPVFPYTSYTKITRQDAKDIYAYLQSIPAVNAPDKAPDLRFPYSLRSSLIVWRALYFHPGEYEPDPKKSKQWNRGAYIVEGLGHCNECHTPRNALGGLDPDKELAGGTIPAQHWYAPDLSLQKGGGLEGWSKKDVVNLLKTGRSSKGYVFGPMADVVSHSTQYMTKKDLRAVATYLASLPPRGPAKEDIERATDLSRGQQVYKNNCSDCHGDTGQGQPGKHPPLDGNSAIIGPTGVNAIRMVLLGGFSPSTAAVPEPYSMPPYAAILDDEDMAAVVNYIRQSWSNNAPPVAASDVKSLRTVPLF